MSRRIEHDKYYASIGASGKLVIEGGFDYRSMQIHYEREIEKLEVEVRKGMITNRCFMRIAVPTEKLEDQREIEFYMCDKHAIQIYKKIGAYLKKRKLIEAV